MGFKKDYPRLYHQIHYWAKRNVPKPDTCNRCHEDKKLELSNNSHLYKFEITEWEWICRSCHDRKDQSSKKSSYTRERENGKGLGWITW